MICKAIQVIDPNVWKFHNVDLGQVGDDESLVEVVYSSLCCTDIQILNGSLLYYKNGVGKYPIVTGHEWCGYLDGTPVTSLCCIGDQSIKRQELGVVGINGAHSEFVIIPNNCLIEIPKINSKYALLEPISVVMHGLCKADISNFSNILVNGYGSIGKICEGILLELGIKPDIYDPRFSSPVENYDKYDLLIECSGNSSSLDKYLSVRGGTIVAFGFEYNSLKPEVLVSNEINFIGTLGSNLEDFIDAVDIIPFLDLPFQELGLSEFEKAISLTAFSRKVVFNNKE